MEYKIKGKTRAARQQKRKNAPVGAVSATVQRFYNGPHKLPANMVKVTVTLKVAGGKKGSK